jgi:hypothetical protein
MTYTLVNAFRALVGKPVPLWLTELSVDQIARAAITSFTPRDFNADGKSDIAWRDTSGNAAVWLMNGAQLTQSAGLGSAPTTWSIVGTGDFDADGKPTFFGVTPAAM